MMTSLNTVKLMLRVMTISAVRGLPIREEEANITTPSFIRKQSLFQTATLNQDTSLGIVPSFGGVPSSDEVTVHFSLVNDEQHAFSFTNSVNSPPTIMLEEWQIQKLLDVRNNVTKFDEKRLHDMDQPIVNITEEQIGKLLPHYRILFNKTLEQPAPSPESRGRRSTEQRICPADPVVTQPQLAINSYGEVVQIVQLNSMNLNQIFFEERCLLELSPISGATCVQVSRYVSALVIDLQTHQFEEQMIEIQSCVGVLYI